MMILSSTPGRRLRRILGALSVLVWLSGCGGGTSQRDPFFPDRVISFGDEASALTPTGLKYSINGISTSTDAGGNVSVVIDCRLQPNWTQSVAGYYGFVFSQCNPSGTTDVRAMNYAAAGAQVDDIKVQVDAQIANGGFQSKDLVTLLAGANDVLALYQQYPQRSEDDLLNEARDRGRRLAQQVNRIIGLGPRVLLATVPDLGLTPFALKQRAEFSGLDRAKLLSDLTAAFNEQLGVTIELDGHYIGLVAADLRVQAMARYGSGLSNVTDGACLDVVQLQDCNNLTLKAGASPNGWLWADDLHFSYAAQAQIAALALDRATRNPF